jgi:hypothetical protein
MKKLLFVSLTVLSIATIIIVMLNINFNFERIIDNAGRIVIKRISVGAPGVNLNCEIYTNSSKSASIKEIYWGDCYPGQTKTYEIYVVNSGNVPMFLSMSTGNWNPQNAQQYISLSWSYDGNIIEPNDGVPITLSLNIDSKVTGIDNFSFDIIITLIQG